MKKKVACLTVFIGALMASVCYGSENISITVDGEALETDTPAQIIEGRTMVPLRAIFEALGANVEWDGSSKSIRAQKDDVSINMQIDNKTFKVGSEEKEIDVPPLIIEGRTMVPARAVAESLNCEVEWDSVNKSVIITTKEDVTTREITTEITTEETTETTTEEVTEETSEIVTDEWWIEYFMARDDKPEPIDDSAFNSEMEKKYHIEARKGIEKNMIYFFGGIYYSVSQMYSHISNDKTNMIDENFNDMWDLFMIEAETAYNYEKEGRNEVILDKKEREAKSNDNKYQLYLFRNKVMGYSCAKYNNNVQVVLISMLDEEASGLNSYVIDFIKSDGVLQYSLIKEDDGTYTIREEKKVKLKGNEEESGWIYGERINVEVKETGLENDKRVFLEKVSELVKESGFLDS